MHSFCCVIERFGAKNGVSLKFITAVKFTANMVPTNSQVAVDQEVGQLLKLMLARVVRQNLVDTSPSGLEHGLGAHLGVLDGTRPLQNVDSLEQDLLILGAHVKDFEKSLLLVISDHVALAVGVRDNESSLAFVDVFGDDATLLGVDVGLDGDQVVLDLEGRTELLNIVDHFGRIFLHDVGDESDAQTRQDGGLVDDHVQVLLLGRHFVAIVPVDVPVLTKMQVGGFLAAGLVHFEL